MTSFQRGILAIAVVALLLAAWMGRYSVVNSGRGLPPVLDRWTGQIHIAKLADE